MVVKEHVKLLVLKLAEVPVVLLVLKVAPQLAIIAVVEVVVTRRQPELADNYKKNNPDSFMSPGIYFFILLQTSRRVQGKSFLRR